MAEAFTQKLSLAQVAKLLSVSPQTVYRWSTKGVAVPGETKPRKLVTWKFGRKVFTDIRSLQAFGVCRGSLDLPGTKSQVQSRRAETRDYLKSIYG